jgi:cytidylate kinase
MGSGAPEIGKSLADELKIDYIDREIIADVAGRLNWSNESVAYKETPPGTLFGRIAEALGKAYPVGSGFGGASLPVHEIAFGDGRYLIGLKTVIKQLAESDAVVIRGRGSQFILKDRPCAVHVLVVAPESLRINRIASEMSLSESDSRKQIERSDNSHREFIRRYFQAELDDPANYDIVLNSARLNLVQAAAIIIHTVKTKEAGAKPQR